MQLNINRSNSNYFGNEVQLVEDINSATVKLIDQDGVCWINKINDLYYLRYCVDDLDLLHRFIADQLTGFPRDHAMLFELKLNRKTVDQDLSALFSTLDLAEFYKQSHHIAYLKNYFKNAGDSSVVVKLNKNNIDDLCNLLPKIANEQLSLTSELLHAIFNNNDYLVLGYYDQRELLGYIILHDADNMENIGFIRDVYVCSGLEDEQRHTVGNAIFNSALNLFADHGFNKAIFWNEKANVHTLELIEKYGFKPYGSEVIVFARNSQSL